MKKEVEQRVPKSLTITISRTVQVKQKTKGPKIIKGKNYLPQDVSKFVLIPGTDGYFINALGIVLGKTGEIGKNRGQKYRNVKVFGKRSESVHRLVWITFVGEIPKNKVINHRDGIPGNDCLENLDLRTKSQNARHAISSGAWVPLKGDKVGRSTISEKTARKIIKLIETGLDNQSIEKQMGCQRYVISDIRRGATWKHLDRFIVNKSSPVLKVQVKDRIRIITLMKKDVKNKTIADKFDVSLRTLANVRNKGIWKNEWARVEGKLDVGNSSIHKKPSNVLLTVKESKYLITDKDVESTRDFLYQKASINMKYLVRKEVNRQLEKL